MSEEKQLINYRITAGTLGHNIGLEFEYSFRKSNPQDQIDEICNEIGGKIRNFLPNSISNYKSIVLEDTYIQGKMAEYCIKKELSDKYMKITIHRVNDIPDMDISIIVFTDLSHVVINRNRDRFGDEQHYEILMDLLKHVE